MKYLIAGGDSFTAELTSWPGILADRNNLIYINNGVPSVGNDYICRSLIYSIQQHLEKGISPTDMVVIPMWTYPDRKSFFVSKYETPVWDVFTSEKTYAVNPASFVKRHKNIQDNCRVSKADTSGWLVGESHRISEEDFIGNFKENYITTYKTNEGSIIETLEWILFLQTFCISQGINNLINLCYSYQSIFYYPHYNVHGERKKNKHIAEEYQENCAHLFKMIKHSSWVTQGFLEYCQDNSLPFMDMVHPSMEGHFEYTKNIIEPKLKLL